MNLLYQKYDTFIQCLVCPHLCKIREGKTGICGVRKNNGEAIELLTYGVVSGYSVDPVEKKPLYHFFPGMNILSLGSYGCNMKCDFCQNWNISQNVADRLVQNMTPEKIITDALDTENNIGVAFTYNEPVIWFEFIRDVSKPAREKGLRTVMVSNGFVTKEPLSEIIDFIDAFNIDLKAFNSDFYKRMTGADLLPVKETLKQIAGSGKHLEITTLIIPGQNDSETEMKLMSEWIAGELGKSTPLHLSRYFPKYKRNDPPTSGNILRWLYETASAYLDYVYIGNTTMPDGQNTSCSNCGTIVTRRTGYHTLLMNLDSEGNCKKCGTKIFSNFISFPKES